MDSDSFSWNQSLELMMKKPLTVALLVTSCFLGEQIVVRIVVMTNGKKSPSEEELDSMWLTLVPQRYHLL